MEGLGESRAAPPLTSRPECSEQSPLEETGEENGRKCIRCSVFCSSHGPDASPGSSHLREKELLLSCDPTPHPSDVYSHFSHDIRVSHPETTEKETVEQSRGCSSSVSGHRASFVVVDQQNRRCSRTATNWDGSDPSCLSQHHQ